MRFAPALLTLATLAGLATHSQAEVFLCSNSSGQVSAQASACAANGARAEPELKAAYAALSDEQMNWYVASVRCVDSMMYRQGHETGDTERQEIISSRVQEKNLPPYFEAQFDAALSQRGSAVIRNPSAFVACTQQADIEPLPKPGAHIALLSFIHPEALHTPTGKAATWMNWAFARDNDKLTLVASQGPVALFSNGSGFVHAVDLATGKARWSYANDTHIDEVVITAQQVYFIDEDPQTIKVLELSSGKPLAPLKRQAPVANLLAAGEQVLFQEKAELVAVNAAGTEQWRIKLSDEHGSAISLYQQTVLVLENSQLLRAFDLASAAPRWKQAMPYNGELRTGTGLYFDAGSAGKLLTLDARTGKTLRTLSVFSEEERVEVDPYREQGYKSSTEDNQLQAIDLRTGKPRWLLTPPQDFSPLQLGYGNGLLLMIGEGGEQVLLVDPKTGKITDQLRTPGLVYWDKAPNTEHALMSNDSSLLVF